MPSFVSVPSEYPMSADVLTPGPTAIWNGPARWAELKRLKSFLGLMKVNVDNRHA